MKRFFDWLDRTFIKPVEESKAPLGVFLLLAFGYILIRNLLEGGLESLHLIGLSSITLQGLEEMLLHLNFSWLFLFIIIAILLHLVTGHELRKVTKVLLAYSFILIIPPLVDPLFRASGYGMFYPNDPRIVPEIVKVGLQPWLIFQDWSTVGPYGSTPGMMIEGWIGGILALIYVALRSPGAQRKFVRSLITSILLIIPPVVLLFLVKGDTLATVLFIALLVLPAVFYLVVTIVDGIKSSGERSRGKKLLVKIGSILAISPIFVLSIAVAGGAQVFANLLPGDPATGKTLYFTGGLIQTSTRKYALVLLLMFIVVVFFGLMLYNKKKWRDLVKSFNPLHLILGAVAAGAGFLLAWLGLKDVLTGVPRNPFDFIALPGIMLMGAMVAGIVNFMVKAFDPSTSGDYKKTLKRGVGGMLVLVIGLAWSLGYVNLYFTLAALFMGVLLALPPIRMARFAITSSLFKALSTFALVLAGYSLFATERTFSVFPWQLYLAVFLPLWAVFLAWELVSRRQKELHSESSERSEFLERGESSE